MTDDAPYAEVRDEPGNRGREAERPGQMPVRGWKDVIVRLKAQMKEDDVPLLAAGVAFFALLALVPSLVALVSVYGLVADPSDVQRITDDALQAAPQEVRELVVLAARGGGGQLAVGPAARRDRRSRRWRSGRPPAAWPTSWARSPWRTTRPMIASSCGCAAWRWP